VKYLHFKELKIDRLREIISLAFGSTSACDAADITNFLLSRLHEELASHQLEESEVNLIEDELFIVHHVYRRC